MRCSFVVVFETFYTDFFIGEKSWYSGDGVEMLTVFVEKYLVLSGLRACIDKVMTGIFIYDNDLYIEMIFEFVELSDLYLSVWWKIYFF